MKKYTPILSFGLAIALAFFSIPYGALLQAQTVQPLSVTCNANGGPYRTGQMITWNASVSGGTGSYVYSWIGTGGVTGSNQTSNVTYTTEGQKNASVTVVSGNQTVTVNCGPIDIQFLPLLGSCNVNTASLAEGGYQVTYNANIFNTSGTTTTYAWTGTDGVMSTNAQLTQKYSTTGVKSATVVAHSDNQSLALSCSVDIHSNIMPAAGSPSPLMGGCNPTVQGMTVIWDAFATGGSAGVVNNGSGVVVNDPNNVPTYTWNIEGQATTSKQQVTYTYPTEGTKTASVTVRYGSEYDTFSCQARVASTTTNGGHCFIATAAFGTPLEPQVMLLRNFRDETLLPHWFGKMFVDAYYKVSPPIADFIRNKESLKATVRVALEPIIFALQHS